MKRAIKILSIIMLIIFSNKLFAQKNQTIKIMLQKTDTATFGAGCFWCVEAIFQQVNGVISVTSGYSGGTKENPNYKEVCTGNTGHAEVCQIVFDPGKA